MLAILIIISLLITIIGLVKVHRDGNYETIWGAMLLFGAIVTLILAVASIGYFLFLSI